MTQYHVIMMDETGCEFSTTVLADNLGLAWDMVTEDYPESRVVDISTFAEIQARDYVNYRDSLREEWDFS